MAELRKRAQSAQTGASGHRPRLAARGRRQILGLAGIAMVAVLVIGAVMAYNQVFSPGVQATVIADRAGLLMTRGASVTLYGADVGRVTSITPDGNQVRLGISVDPRQVVNIPADVRASIQAPTVFGPKYLSLVVPARPAGQRLRPGQVIEPTEEPTEVDTVFASLSRVLGSVDPARLSATLGAISTALSGNGGRVGAFIGQLDSYLREFNPSLPALSADAAAAPAVLRTLATAAPDLIATLGNLRDTSRTLVGEQAQFDAFLVDLTGFSGHARGFLNANGGALSAALATLAPVTGTLAEYSPEFPCLFASANEENQLGTSSHRMAMSAAIVPGKRPYTYPADLPTVSASSGPGCYGGPLTRAQAANWNLVTFDDGTNGFFSGGDNLTPGSPPLAVRLFGTSGAAAAEKAAKSGSPEKGK